MSISIDLARRVLEACKQRARELRSPVSIAIVDASGHLVLFERMMAPYGWATGNISIAKANTSVMFNQTTEAVAQWATSIPGFAASLSAMTDGKFIMATGGWPIRLNGVTIGGLGISGGNAPGRDDDIARAGLSILAPVSPQVPVYTPQAAADQAAAPAQAYSNGSAEYPASVPIPNNSPVSDMTENTRRTRDTEKIREAILNAAATVFAEHGFDGARIDAIAEASGYNKSLIGQYFGDKLGLYAEVNKRIAGTKYLSNEESTSLGKFPSSNANLQERSGDES